MKKLSIVLALIMALSCFSITAFAEESTAEASTEAAAMVPVKVIVHWATVEDLDKEEAKADTDIWFKLAVGTKLTPEMIIKGVKESIDGNGDLIVDGSEYVLSDKVAGYDDLNGDGVANDVYNFTGTTIKAGETYEYHVFATEINDINAFAEQLAKLDWAGIAKANVTLYNQIIAGTKAAVEALVKGIESVDGADKKDDAAADKKDEAAADNKTEAPAETPDTGVSAVAGAAVVVLALSATTAVVLRKKED